MSLRTWLLERIAAFSGNAEDDPDLTVQFMVVPLYEVPILQEVLSQSGIASQVTETFDAVVMQEKACLMVRSADLSAASDAVTEFKTRP
ncbi:MAG: hypothetical protein ACRBK7_08925 [Acidimicrobiales bacterium]